MKSRFNKILIILFIFSLAVDIMVLRIIWMSPVFSGAYPYALIIQAFISVAFYAVIIRLLMRKQSLREGILKNGHYVATGMLILFYLPKLILLSFNLVEEALWLIFAGVEWVLGQGDFSISRSYIISWSGTVLGAIIFIFIFIGIVWGRFAYKVKHVHLSTPSFPKPLNPFKIVQISDLHIGSFQNHKEHLEKAVHLTNSQNPDIICFTGDLVNIFAEEAGPFVPLLQKLNAPLGKYAILGNHDYGEYYPWPSENDRIQNFNDLVDIITKAGFRLLRNESVKIRKGNDYFILAGVENWGLPPFPQYGDLRKSVKGAGKDDFIVLLSHDPSHWDAEVKKNPAIFLTLSGHTHAMQFGISLGPWMWSPVKWKYKKWAGLYHEHNQYLYVNKGLGFIGFPGRVGMYPEITVFHLTSET